MNQGTYKPLGCSKCGAPLTAKAAQQVVTCEYCGQSHSFVPAPPPEPAGTSFAVGEQVAVQWGEVWWPAKVTSVVGAQAWRVRYRDWGEKWDETVGPERIRHRTVDERRRWNQPKASAAEDAKQVGAVAGSISGGACVIVLLVVLGVGLAIALAARSVSRSTSTAGPQPRGGSVQAGAATGNPKASYTKGELVEIHWGSKWWEGSIVAVQGKDSYLISYDGWNASWNEVVGPERLRLPGGKTKKTAPPKKKRRPKRTKPQ